MTHTSHEVNVNSFVQRAQTKRTKFERSTMMKKLLVLALVLAVAGLANAGLVTTELGTGLQVVVDNTAKTFSFVGTALAVPTNQPTSITGLSLSMSIDAGSIALVGTYGLAQQGQGFELTPGDGTWVGYAANANDGKVGTLATFSYTSSSATKVSLFNDDIFGNSEFNTFSGGTVATPLAGMEFSIPEPMTMVLLGLGGLFLRKKK